MAAAIRFRCWKGGESVSFPSLASASFDKFRRAPADVAVVGDLLEKRNRACCWLDLRTCTMLPVLGGGRKKRIRGEGRKNKRGRGGGAWKRRGSRRKT